MELTIKDVSVFFDGVDHSEGVCVHPDGSVWSGGEAGQVYRIAADGSAKEEIANTGGFNLGLAFSPGAKWLAICDNGKKCIWKLDVETRKLEKFADLANNPIVIEKNPSLKGKWNTDFFQKFSISFDCLP